MSWHNHWSLTRLKDIKEDHHRKPGLTSRVLCPHDFKNYTQGCLARALMPCGLLKRALEVLFIGRIKTPARLQKIWGTVAFHGHLNNYQVTQSSAVMYFSRWVTLPDKLISKQIIDSDGDWSAAFLPATPSSAQTMHSIDTASSSKVSS